MKKTGWFSLTRLGALICCAAMMLSGCSAPKGAKTPEELIKRYMDALSHEKYEAVLDLLPDEIIEYGMEYLDGDREDIVGFVKYAAHDYYWLQKAHLTAHPGYSFVITEQQSEFPEEKKPGSVLMEEKGVRLYVKDALSISVEVDTGAEEAVEGYFFLIRIDDRWYMTSVAGDDEFFRY